MRSFKIILKTVGIFLLIVTLLSVLFAEMYFRGENFDYQDYRERDELAGKLTLLVCGTSNVVFGVQPEILNKWLGVSSYNLACPLLTMEGRYTLLEKELARNPVHTVILEVSVDALIRDRETEGPEGDLPILGKLSDAGERWSYFTENFSLSEYPMVYYDVVSKGIESCISLFTAKYHRRNVEANLGYYGVRKDSRELPTNYRDIYHIRTLSEDIREENVRQLERILELCKEHGATVIMISTPKSKAYNCMYDNLEFFNEWFSSFAAEHNVYYLNFNLAKETIYRLPDAECYYDETHLNPAGADIFSRMLGDCIKDIYAYQNVWERFYPSYQSLIWIDGYLDS